MHEKTKRRGITRLGPDLYEIRVRTTDPRSGIRKESQRTENVSFKEACAIQDRLEAELAREPHRYYWREVGPSDTCR